GGRPRGWSISVCLPSATVMLPSEGLLGCGRDWLHERLTTEGRANSPVRSPPGRSGAADDECGAARGRTAIASGRPGAAPAAELTAAVGRAAGDVHRCLVAAVHQAVLSRTRQRRHRRAVPSG